MLTLGVNDGVNAAVNLAQSSHARFTVVAALIGKQHRGRIFKHLCAKPQLDPVLGEVGRVLRRIELDLHTVYYMAVP